ncbi:MAG TPA: hypothetical protein VFT50_11535 [Baekduia sp.]|nr:hypothetical protein [Baekduia sp.]
MSRPRIRTIKPQFWEELGRMSRDARLLAAVLITMADDDGRWRHLPAKIIGHGFAHDHDVTPAKLEKWTREVEARETIVRYEVAGEMYGTFPKWHAHQVINRYTPSSLPPCNLTEVSVIPHRSRTDESSLEGKGREGSTQTSIATPTSPGDVVVELPDRRTA